MSKILNIETSTEVCSVCISEGKDVLAIRESKEGLNHSLLLGSYIKEVLQEVSIKAENLDAIAVSMGPGSYTGLRIGVSIAKGLCFGANIPLIAVSTLQALALSVSQNMGYGKLYCPMIDARRMEVYTAIYDGNNNIIEDVNAKIIDEFSFANLLNNNEIIFFGNGSGKVVNTIKHTNAVFIDNIKTSSTMLIPIAEKKIIAKDYEDTAYFEPFYLKDFIATTPKKKVL